MLGAAGALSSDGVCISFDDDAHGYARGEGAAILILKSLSQAIVDGDHVLATIKGSAIAQDGKTNGIMAPNAKSQELVARKALKQAGIDPLSVGYIEAHATSTSLGDPTEVSAISAVYGTGRPSDAPALIGSIKPNVGHLEAAAGAISLVKAVMAVKKGLIPPQSMLNKLNTRVDWLSSGLQVVRESTCWGCIDGPRRAAICSYGYGGTVSHAIIEQSTHPFFLPQEHGGTPTLLLLSAPQGKQRLAVQSAAQAEWIFSAGQSESLLAIAATLSQRRAHHDFRAAFVVFSHSDAARALTSFFKGIEGEWVSQGRVFDSRINKDVVWVFSGHGAQWKDMGKKLLEDPLFYHTIAPLDQIVLQELGYSALDSLRFGTFEESDEIQVVTYLVQVGPAQVLKSKGTRPKAIIGHSVGEIAASVIAGCLTLEEGTIIVARRARLYAQVKGLGGMYLVNLPYSEVAADLTGTDDVVAAIESSPLSCVVSGLAAPLSNYVESLKVCGIRTFQVKTDIAFHSPMLEILSSALKDALSGAITPRHAQITLCSTSQFGPRTTVLRDVDYWVKNMVRPVWLTTGVKAAVQDSHRIFLEVSTHPIVSQSVNETLESIGLDEYTTIPIMRRGQPADKSILYAIAQLHIRGVGIDFSTFIGRQWSPEVPHYQWIRKPFWKEVSHGLSATRLHDVDMHTMLGHQTVITGTDTTLFTTTLDESVKPFPRPHQLHGTNIIPAGVYVNTFHHATGATTLFDMEFQVPLVVTDDPRDVQVLAKGGDITVASCLTSSVDHSWVTHSYARWSNEPINQESSLVDIKRIKRRIGKVLPNTFSIDYLVKVGVSGMAFPWAVTEHHGNSTEMLVTVDNDPTSEIMTWDIESWAPTLDAASSVGATIFSEDQKLRIISSIGKLIIRSKRHPPKVFCLHVQKSDTSDDKQSRSVDISILGPDGDLLLQIESMRLAEVVAASRYSAGINGLVHQIAWVPARLSEKPLLLNRVVIISPDTSTLRRYGDELDQQFAEMKMFKSTDEMKQANVDSFLRERGSAVIYCPGPVQNFADISTSSYNFIWQIATTVKFIVKNGLSSKLFIITDWVYSAVSATALAQGALLGLARVVASEHSDIWGGLIDNESPQFPVMPLKYVHEQDVIHFVEGVPRVAHMRPFSSDQIHTSSGHRTLLPKAEGTYVITGGLGALGFETCDFLIEKGARRIVVVSRRKLPPRNQWSKACTTLFPILTRIKAMENLGATIHTVSMDIGAVDAHLTLLAALEHLSLPPVLGIIHVSGVLEDSLLIETASDSFVRVLTPKISGAIALHRAFPPGTLDFFILYSSIGELVGTPGQSSYASGNSFLDVLATHRRTTQSLFNGQPGAV
jgi:6-methylsalicylic acid synthase